MRVFAFYSPAPIGELNPTPKPRQTENVQRLAPISSDFAKDFTRLFVRTDPRRRAASVAEHTKPLDYRRPPPNGKPCFFFLVVITKYSMHISLGQGQCPSVATRLIWGKERMHCEGYQGLDLRRSPPMLSHAECPHELSLQPAPFACMPSTHRDRYHAFDEFQCREKFFKPATLTPWQQEGDAGE